MEEHNYLDKKSITFLKGNKTDWDELAKDCVAFANARGGDILIGIEDDASVPPLKQVVKDKNIAEKIHKNIAYRTINVSISVNLLVADNNSDYIKVQVFRNAQTIASTTDGRYYIRIDDECRPIPPDEMGRLAAEKNAFVWELQTNKRINKDNVDAEKKSDFLKSIRSSERVSSFIKQKTDDELLEYYLFIKDNYLTNLGILWIGKRNDRASLLYAPAIQVIRYNDQEQKVWKLVLDDYSDNPKELLEKIINDVPDWKESIEIADGIFRKNIPFFPLEVVRELVANALVHRVYTTRGDIFINIFQDKLEIHSPGRLPYGVTPSNILIQSVRRNEHLSKVFYDLGLMEREGSGYDLIYEKLLGTGKPIPVVNDFDDRVTVTIQKQFISKSVVQLMDKASQEYQLKQREIIALGVIAQHNTLSALEISKLLNQNDEQGLRSWIGRLVELKLIESKGKTRGKQYFVNPEYLRQLNFKAKTNLKAIEDHRLQELLYTDIKSNPNASFSEVHERIGKEINQHKIRRTIKIMLENEVIKSKGVNKWTRYYIE